MKKRRSRSFFPLAVGVVLFVLQTPFGGWATQLPIEPPAAKRQPPVSRGIVYDDYDFNNTIYNTCFPQLDMAAGTLYGNPSAICLIEGYRDRHEKRWVSKKRSENAKRYLVEFKKIAPERILAQDRGFEKLPAGLPGVPRSTNSGKISQNGGIVISVYLPLDWKAKKETQMLPCIYDGYRRNEARYNTCYPHLDMAIGQMREDPNLLCFIEGHRETNEKRAVSVTRAKKAELYLHLIGSVDPSRTRFIDGGPDDRLWLDPTGSVPRPFLGHTNRFIAIGLFYPVAIWEFE